MWCLVSFMISNVVDNAQHQLPNIFMHQWVKTWENKKEIVAYPKTKQF